MNFGNEPAYPWGENGTLMGGLTKREIFAAMAMSGLLYRHDLSSEERARYAVENADDLLAALEKN